MLIPADSYAVMRCKIFFCPNSQQLTLDLEAETLIVLFGNTRFWDVVNGVVNTKKVKGILPKKLLNRNILISDRGVAYSISVLHSQIASDEF